MFDIDRWVEIWVTITRNKTRSLLTCFGVFWGIFMLVALIGGGQGLQDMMQKNFEGFATNSGFLAAQKTDSPRTPPSFSPTGPASRTKALTRGVNGTCETGTWRASGNR